MDVYVCVCVNRCDKFLFVRSFDFQLAFDSKYYSKRLGNVRNRQRSVDFHIYIRVWSKVEEEALSPRR